jgi:thioredoxin-related protein
MLNRSGLLCVFLYLLSFQANAQNKGIIFFEGSWEDALAKAQKEHKIIFVDAYTTWCGPCKRMSAEVFTDAAVGEYFNKNFVNLKIDMEKSEGIKFGQKYEVSSYPTLLFIDAEGKEVNVAKGSRPADQFLALAKATLNGLDNSADYAEKYEAGERSPEFLRAYAYQLQMADKPTLKIANDYLRTQKDLTTVSNLEFLLDFCTESDSRIFDLLCQHQAAVLKTHRTGLQRDPPKIRAFGLARPHRTSQNGYEKSPPQFCKRI